MDIFILPDQLEFRVARAYLKHLSLVNNSLGNVILTENVNSWGAVNIDPQTTERLIVIGGSVKQSHVPYIQYLHAQDCETLFIGTNVSDSINEVSKVIASEEYIEALYSVIRPDIEDLSLTQFLEQCEVYLKRGTGGENQKVRAFVGLLSTVSSEFIDTFSDLKSFDACNHYLQVNYILLSSIATQRENILNAQLSRGTVVNTSIGPILVVLGLFATEVVSDRLKEQNLSGLIGISPTKGHDLISVVSGTVTAKDITDLLDFPSLGTTNHRTGFIGIDLAKPFIDALSKV